MAEDSLTEIQLKFNDLQKTVRFVPGEDLASIRGYVNTLFQPSGPIVGLFDESSSVSIPFSLLSKSPAFFTSDKPYTILVDKTAQSESQTNGANSGVEITELDAGVEEETLLSQRKDSIASSSSGSEDDDEDDYDIDSAARLAERSNDEYDSIIIDDDVIEDLVIDDDDENRNSKNEKSQNSLKGTEKSTSEMLKDMNNQLDMYITHREKMASRIKEYGAETTGAIPAKKISKSTKVNKTRATKIPANASSCLFADEKDDANGAQASGRVTNRENRRPGESIVLPKSPRTSRFAKRLARARARLSSASPEPEKENGVDMNEFSRSTARLRRAREMSVMRERGLSGDFDEEETFFDPYGVNEDELVDEFFADMQYLTGLSEEELTQTYLVFQTYAREGALDRNTFGECFSHFIPTERLKLMEDCKLDVFVIQRAFDVFDSATTGLVDFAEFSTGLAILYRGTSEDKARLVFELFDEDGDNFISFREMYRYMTSFYRVCFGSSRELQAELEDIPVEEFAYATAQSVFFRADVTRDNLLSFAEFRRWYLDPSDHADTTNAVKILQTLGHVQIPIDGVDLLSDEEENEKAREDGRVVRDDQPEPKSRFSRTRVYSCDGVRQSQSGARRDSVDARAPTPLAPNDDTPTKKEDLDEIIAARRSRIESILRERSPLPRKSVSTVRRAVSPLQRRRDYIRSLSTAKRASGGVDVTMSPSSDLWAAKRASSPLQYLRQRRRSAQRMSTADSTYMPLRHPYDSHARRRSASTSRLVRNPSAVLSARKRRLRDNATDREQRRAYSPRAARTSRVFTSTGRFGSPMRIPGVTRLAGRRSVSTSPMKPMRQTHIQRQSRIINARTRAVEAAEFAEEEAALRRRVRYSLARRDRLEGVAVDEEGDGGVVFDGSEYAVPNRSNECPVKPNRKWYSSPLKEYRRRRSLSSPLRRPRSPMKSSIARNPASAVRQSMSSGSKSRVSVSPKKHTRQASPNRAYSTNIARDIADTGRLKRASQVLRRRGSSVSSLDVSALEFEYLVCMDALRDELSEKREMLQVQGRARSSDMRDVYSRVRRRSLTKDDYDIPGEVLLEGEEADEFGGAEIEEDEEDGVYAAEALSRAEKAYLDAVLNEKRASRRDSRSRAQSPVRTSRLQRAHQRLGSVEAQEKELAEVRDTYEPDIEALQAELDALEDEYEAVRGSQRELVDLHKRANFAKNSAAGPYEYEAPQTEAEAQVVQLQGELDHLEKLYEDRCRIAKELGIELDTAEEEALNTGRRRSGADELGRRQSILAGGQRRRSAVVADESEGLYRRRSALAGGDEEEEEYATQEELERLAELQLQLRRDYEALGLSPYKRKLSARKSSVYSPTRIRARSSMLRRSRPSVSPLRARTRLVSRGNSRLASISPLRRAASNSVLRGRGEKWVSSPRKGSVTVRGVGLRNLARNATNAQRDVAQIRAEAPLWRLCDEDLDYYGPDDEQEEEEEEDDDDDMEFERMTRRAGSRRLSSRQARRLLGSYYGRPSRRESLALLMHRGEVMPYVDARESLLMRRGEMMPYADARENEEQEIEDEHVVGGSGRRSRLGFADFGEGFPDESTAKTATPPREKAAYRRSSSLLRDAPRGRPTGNVGTSRNAAAKASAYDVRRNVRSITKVGPRVVSAGRPKSGADSGGSGLTRRLRSNGAPATTGVAKTQKAKKASKKVVTQSSSGTISRKPKNSEATAGGAQGASGDDSDEEWSFRPAEVQGARPPTRRDVSHPLDL